MSLRLHRALSRLSAWWDRYWFTPSPLRNLAICRLLLFALMMWDSSRFRVLVRPVGDAPAVFFKPIIIIQLLHLGPPTTRILDIVYYSLIFFGIGALIGWRTKFCIFIYLLLYIYWIGEWFSFGVVHHGHAIFAFFIVALLLSPCEKALSVDDLRARIKLALKQRKLQKESVESPVSEWACWPLRLIQVMICLIYFLSGFAKLQLNPGLEWANGSTLQYYLLFHNTAYGMRLAQNFLLCRLLSFSTLILELGFPIILVIPRLAWIVLPVAALFHIGTLYTMDTFFYQFIFCYIAFINFDRLIVWAQTRLTLRFGARTLKVIFDGGCLLCIRSMTLISYFDWLGRIEYIDLRDWPLLHNLHPALDREKCLEQMHVIDRGARTYAGFFAFRRLAWAIPILWILLPILYIPIVSSLGQRIYRWVARNRSRAQTVCTMHICK